MTDKFDTFTPGLESPASHVQGVTPDDASDLPYVSRALNVATTGYVRITTTGATVETVYVAAGGAFPVRATRVWQSGTTATGIVAMY